MDDRFPDGSRLLIPVIKIMISRTVPTIRKWRSRPLLSLLSLNIGANNALFQGKGALPRLTEQRTFKYIYRHLGTARPWQSKFSMKSKGLGCLNGTRGKGTCFEGETEVPVRTSPAAERSQAVTSEVGWDDGGEAIWANETCRMILQPVLRGVATS